MAVIAKVRFHHHQHHPPPSPHTFLLQLYQNPISHFYCRSISASDRRFFLIFSPWPRHVRRSRRWDSNAQSYNTNNFNFDDNVEIEDIDDTMEQGFQALDDYIDSIWIFKVFGSFGWMLPLIISSILLATGPKAFLMALALPIGQSTFAFAIQRYQNRGKIKPKLNNKTSKKKPRAYTSSTNSTFEEAAEWIGSERATKKKKKKGYQSWVWKNDGPVSSRDGIATDFGGWDELDAGMECNVGSSRKAVPRSSRKRAHKGENRRGSENYGPLLLRLLVSVFPFLSSWTKLL